jgi:alpha-L-fucosidase
MAWWRQSMATRNARLGWWRQARFGMFVHWGVYSQLGGVWEGIPVRGYAEHIQRMRQIPVAVYREKVAGRFDPTAFDADAWIRAARDAGMGYFVITAKHHDGFAMFDSQVSPYNVVQATPWKRDPMRALKEACARHGLKFGFYYSHAFDWGERDGAGNDWDYDNPGGDRHLWGGDRWYEQNPQRLARVRRYVDGKAIPQLRELIRKYDPDILWFDTPHKLPAEENLRILRAVREAKPDIVVNGRSVQALPDGPPARFGDYQSTADKPAEFPPQDGDWEGIPTTNESYGWHQMDHSHKPPEHFIRLLAKAAARGGNLLLNVGPMGDGRMDPRDLAILGGIGAWMKTNGDSIRGTTRTPLPVQAWGESTRKGSTLYLHVFARPRGGRLTVGGLLSPVKRATLLADGQPLEIERAGAKDLLVHLPPAAPDAVDSVVALEIAGDEIAVDRARLLSTDVGADTLRVFDGERIGPGLAFGAGKTRDAWVHGWSHLEAAVSWPVRLAAPATYQVSIAYDADQASAGGRYRVRLGDQILEGTVRPTLGAPVGLGTVRLAPGSFEIRVEAVQIAGGELMRLRGLTLSPI